MFPQNQMKPQNILTTSTLISSKQCASKQCVMFMTSSEKEGLMRSDVRGSLNPTARLKALVK